MLSAIRNPFVLLVAASSLVGVIAEEDASRVKRGAAVYVTFPSGGPAPHVEKNPQDFINAVGANNDYSASGGYGGSILAQYNQQNPAPTGGHGGGGGGSSYGRRKRSANNNYNFPQTSFEYNPYHTFDPPSWSTEQNLETSYSAPVADYENETPYSLNLPNPVSVEPLLQAATSSNKGMASVFRAYTARTPYFGLNVSIQPEEITNATFNA